MDDMIKIVTDSTCDLTPESIEKYGIHVEPMLVEIDGVTYRDGIEMTRDKFFDGLPRFRDIPKTAACSPGSLLEAYRAAHRAGATGILSVHISARLSGVCAAANIAAEDARAEGIDVRVVDSMSLSMGLGYLLELAGEMREKGATLAEIGDALDAKRLEIRMYALIDTLTYLRKGGRVSNLSAFVGELLKIKPLVHVKDGLITTIDKARTRSQGIDRLFEDAVRFAAGRKVLSASIMHSTGPIERDLQDMASRIRTLWGIEPVAPRVVTPIIGTHTGPAGLGLVVILA